MYLLIILLSVLVVGAGWFWGRQFRQHKNYRKQDRLSKDYFIGLNYLLNEQPDAAIDIFIRLLEVDSNTVETHMALGSLFRRQGETERAIRIHQNIITRPNLSEELRVQALQALGRDYMVAGVFDRAERLFLESVDIETKHQVQSLHYLLDIYEREKDWFAALEIAQKIQKQTNEDKSQAIAHYYCEFIEDSRHPLSVGQSHHYLQLALQADKYSIRASLLKAKHFMQQKEYKSALKLYKRLLKQEPSFLPEILSLLENVYQQLNNTKGLLDYLYKYVGTEQGSQPLLMVIVAQQLQLLHGTLVAVDFLTEQLQDYPSLKGIEYLLTLRAQLLQGKEQQQVVFLATTLRRLLAEKAQYVCEHCGFSGKKLHWLCPSCRRWGNIKPVVA